MKSTLMITAAVLAFSLTASSNIVLAGDKTGNAPGGTGIEESTESEGATDKQGGAGMMPSTGAGSETQGGPNSSDEGGTGIKASSEGKGATDKSTEDKGAPMGSQGGASAGNAPGGTGVETSSQGEGSKDKTSN